jgi:hypothetical protein
MLEYPCFSSPFAKLMDFNAEVSLISYCYMTRDETIILQKHFVHFEEALSCFAAERKKASKVVPEWIRQSRWPHWHADQVCD